MNIVRERFSCDARSLHFIKINNYFMIAETRTSRATKEKMRMLAMAFEPKEIRHEQRHFARFVCVLHTNETICSAFFVNHFCMCSTFSAFIFAARCGEVQILLSPELARTSPSENRSLNCYCLRDQLNCAHRRRRVVRRIQPSDERFPVCRQILECTQSINCLR